jgi:hypothetical protein
MGGCVVLAILLAILLAISIVSLPAKFQSADCADDPIDVLIAFTSYLSRHCFRHSAATISTAPTP